VQTKDQLYGVSTTVLYVLLYRRSIKSQWTVRNTKVHKGLVIEIMEGIKKEVFPHKTNHNKDLKLVEMIK